MDDSARTGLSLAALRELAGRVATEMGKGASIVAVVESIIRPATRSQSCSYVELLPDDDRGVPCMVLVASWSMNFSVLIESLTQELLPDEGKSFFIWIDVLSCNLSNTATDNRLDALSHAAATVQSPAPSCTDTDAAANQGLPTSALEAYRRAIRTVSSIPPSTTSISSTTVADTPADETSAQRPTSTALAVVFDAEASVLTSPWCLYGIWLYMHHHRAAVASGSVAAVTPLCSGPLDVLVTQIVWENLSLLLPSPHTPDPLHALILEEVAAEEPIPLPPDGAPTTLHMVAAKCAAAATQGEDGAATADGAGDGRSGGDRGSGDNEQEPDVEARISAADDIIKYSLLKAFEQRVQSLVAVTAAAESTAPQPVNCTPTAAVSAPPSEPADAASDPSLVDTDIGRSLTTSKGTTDGQPPPTRYSTDRLQLLATASDVYGCLLWAAGRPLDAEAHLRRAHELVSHHPQLPPLLPLLVLLHLGGLLHVLPRSLYGDEAERLLRGAIVRLDAVHDAAGVAAVVAGGASANGAPGSPCTPPESLLSAQARHFLARLLCLWSSATAAVTTSHSITGATGLHHIHRSRASHQQHTATVSGSADVDSRNGEMEAVQQVAPEGSAALALSGAASMQLPPGAAHVEAVPLLRAALPVFETQYGGTHPLTATLLSNLAMALKDQDKLDEAEALLRRALSASEATHGCSHLETLRCMNNLAGLLEAQGMLEEAETLLRRAADLAAAVLGPGHAYTATALSNFGLALRKAGKLQEAEELLRTALRIREKLLGPLALDTAASLGDVTLLLMDTGRLAEAEPLLRRILDIRQLVLGPDHRDTAAALYDLAEILVHLDRPVDAEPLLRRAISVQIRSLGPGHEHTASSTRELGKVLAQQGQAVEAERLWRQALAIMESVLGPNHPETVITINQLAVHLKETGRSAEAEALFQRVLSLTDSLDVHASTADGSSEATNPAALAGRRRLRAAAMIAMRGLAELAGAAGRLTEAEVLSCRALVASERALGATHSVTLACAEGLAEVLCQLDLLEDAAELYGRLVETLAEEQGEEGEQVIRYLGLYEAVYTQMQERDGRQQEQQHTRHEDEDAANEDGDGVAGAERNERTEADVAASDVQTSKYVRITADPVDRYAGASSTVARSSESVSSIMSVLLGPLGRNITLKRRAIAAKGQRDRESVAAMAAVSGITAGSNQHGGGGRNGLHHSFASFVSRRSQTQERGNANVGTRSRSIVYRVHSSLVAMGRIRGGGPLADGTRDGGKAETSVAAEAASANNHDGKSFSPGLPHMDEDEVDAAGASMISLSVPRPRKASGSGSSSGEKSSSLKARVSEPVEELYDVKSSQIVVGPYGSVTVSCDVDFGGVGGRGVGHQSVPGRPPGGALAARRRSADNMWSVNHFMLSISQRGISKKVLLQQANIDLEDDNDDDCEGDRVQPNRNGPREGIRDMGMASLRGGGPAVPISDGGATAAAAAAAGVNDDEFEDTSSVGCCGFGGGVKRRVRPTGT